MHQAQWSPERPLPPPVSLTSQSHLDGPVVKGTSGILALTAEEINGRPASSCIRCGSCVTICPCGLSPVEMAAFIRKDNLEGAAKLGVMDCFSCGSCSWVCPSHIPLVHYFNYAKGMLNDLDRELRKNEHVKALVEARPPARARPSDRVHGPRRDGLPRGRG